MKACTTQTFQIDLINHVHMGWEDILPENIHYLKATHFPQANPPSIECLCYGVRPCATGQATRKCDIGSHPKSLKKFAFSVYFKNFMSKMSYLTFHKISNKNWRSVTHFQQKCHIKTHKILALPGSLSGSLWLSPVPIPDGWIVQHYSNLPLTDCQRRKI